jgi:hypothetical protein
MFPPGATSSAERKKAQHLQGFLACAEEDSNLHPVIPDQALKRIWAVCDASVWL